MTYTFTPKQGYAKVYSRNVRISTKSAEKICSVIRKKPLNRAKRLLEDLSSKRRSLRGKYYTNTVKEFVSLVNNCEKNAEFLGLEKDRLFVHASAHMGNIFRRRRRRSGFGSRMKSTNVEIMLIERGREKAKPAKRVSEKASEIKKEDVKEKNAAAKAGDAQGKKTAKPGKKASDTEGEVKKEPVKKEAKKTGVKKASEKKVIDTEDKDK